MSTVVAHMRAFLNQWELFAKLSTILIAGSVLISGIVLWLWHGDGPALVLGYMLPGIAAFIGGVCLIPEAISRARWRQKGRKADDADRSEE